jgi:hypothetical protein
VICGGVCFLDVQAHSTGGAQLQPVAASAFEKRGKMNANDDLFAIGILM